MSVMKWYTRAWATGRVPDDDDAAIEVARAATDEVAKAASDSLRPLVEQADHRLRFDDARILSLDPSVGGGIEMTLLQGELTEGYGLLSLTFSDAELLDTEVAASLLPLRTPEIWYFEFDFAPSGCFELRLLLWPAGELAIRFRNVSWSWEPRLGRDAPGAHA